MSFLSSVGSYVGSFFTRESACAVGITGACTAGLKILYEASDYLGQRAFSMSGGRVSLHNIIPESLKDRCRLVGDFFRYNVITPIGMNAPRIGFINDRLPLTDYYPLSSTVGACPIIEEGIFRALPLAFVTVMRQIPSMNERMIEIGDVGASGADITNLAILFFQAVCFTYYHENESGTQRLQPGRAAGILLSGVAYYLIAENFGIGTAILAHASYNLSSFL